MLLARLGVEVAAPTLCLYRGGASGSEPGRYRIHSTVDAPTQLQDSRILRDLPLLPADVRVTYCSLSVDDEETRPLAQGENAALHLVAVIDRALLVNQAGERDSVLFEVGPCMLSGVVEDGDDLRTRPGERLVLLRQLTEVPAAGGSHEAPQEHQDNASLPTVITERDVSSRCGRQREAWCHGADSYPLTGDWHIFFRYGRTFTSVALLQPLLDPFAWTTGCVPSRPRSGGGGTR